MTPLVPVVDLQVGDASAATHRWVGNGEYGSSEHGYMCGDCGVDHEDADDDEPCPAAGDNAPVPSEGGYMPPEMDDYHANGW
ncbi:hypothetical protein [Longimicrobium sp.]|uniref:hypothetical protein n=1 Tax=Longimicrobium sp. TaxID=2029185 RepID=UPI002F943E90